MKLLFSLSGIILALGACAPKPPPPPMVYHTYTKVYEKSKTSTSTSTPAVKVGSGYTRNIGGGAQTFRAISR